ncbi:histidine kinase [uncultured Azohydromonas sp.]|uniref:sensor histidine kinase n=1 Tax=uncultured Azohydromonas sp. TaxID=487342 RepID=UPI002609CAAB|nr:histidine kinase [uncultured Azohydromonas sp.]
MPPRPPLLLLGRALRWRLGAVALAVVAVLGWSDWREWRQRNAQALPSTAALAAQLLADDLARHASAFDRSTHAVTLAPLRTLAQRAPLCVAVSDIYGHRVRAGCLPHEDGDPDGAPARWARRLAGGTDAQWTHTLTLALSEGVKAGTVEVQPHWALEGRLLWQRWAWLAAAAAALMGMLWLASRLVARSLAPANQVLGALARLAADDLQVRLPPMRLRELEHIGQGFNRLAEHLGELRRRQQQLSLHLLQVREAERRRLARELHDEMGQSLTALQAEAAAMSLMTQALPQAAASAQAMSRTTAQLLDGLQRVLADLRPQALDRFGLAVALQSLANLPRRRADGSTLRVRLALPQPWTPLPPDHDIHVYRIVQEALTNALRHSGAASAAVALRREAGGLRLSVADDGAGPEADLPPSGHGLLGLRERVLALGGRLDWERPAGGGLCLRVWLPLDERAAEEGARGAGEAGTGMEEKTT